MINFSLAISKILKNEKILKNLDKNIYYKIKYPINKIMIIDDNLDFGLLNDLCSKNNIDFVATNLKCDKDLNNLIIKYTDYNGIINKNFLFFKINAKNIKKYGSIIKPNYILINESSDVINELEVKEIFDEATIISDKIFEFEGIKYSLNDKSADYFISEIDCIKEKIKINNKFDINIKDTNDKYLKEILMLFVMIKEFNLDIKIFNEINQKNFSYENKKIYMSTNENNYNEAIRFISRYNDYKVIIIGWKSNYEDISWLYNIEFERLINKNIQKIYCIGTNAFDIATRLRYADLNEKIIVASSNIDVILKEINNYNLNLYILTDEHYINIIKGGNK